jgi:imidazolonepropionase-like amidohydrolase
MRTPLFVLFFSGIFALVFVPALSAQSQPSSVYAITHARIFTLAGSPLEDATLVIRDGKIAAIGASVEVPAGAKLIDARGLQVYPGLFDSITQMGLREIAAVSATVDSSETGNYNPDVVAATAVSPSSEHIPVTRAAGITEVLAVPGSGGLDFFGSSGIIGGQASAIHLAGWAIDEMLLKKSAAMVLNWPEIETQTFDFATFSRKEKPYADAKQEYDKQVNEMILAGGSEAYKAKDLLRSKEIPVILRPMLSLPLEDDDPYDRLLSQPVELSAAGVKFAIASFDNSFARRLGQNAANAVAYGLPYDEALRAVTVYPAQIFGLAGQLGTLEQGKLANLIVTNGDPLELTTDVKYLFIKGQLTSTNNRHKSLYEKYLNRPKPAD